MKFKLSYSILLTPIVYCAYAMSADYDNLSIIITAPSIKTCDLTDNPFRPKWKFNGNLEVSSEYVSCEVKIPEVQFKDSFEVCYLSGIRIPTLPKGSTTDCTYLYPNYFRAEIIVDKKKVFNRLRIQ